jgi:hypothetical protein
MIEPSEELSRPSGREPHSEQGGTYSIVLYSIVLLNKVALIASFVRVPYVVRSIIVLSI